MNLEATSALERMLVESAVEEVVSFLSFTESRLFLGCSSSLWRLRTSIESQTTHFLCTPQDKVAPYLLNPINRSITGNIFSPFLSESLLHLTLDECIDDTFLAVNVQEMRLFPNLEKIRMRHCPVTDWGLRALAKGFASSATQSLREIDICFTDTTYGGTFPLRDTLKNLRLLRRQPEWLDGNFLTPFGDGEIHTYYADGSFSFTRSSSSIGFVSRLVSLEDNHLTDELQYSDFHIPQGWPRWTQFAYRPGVALLRLPQLDGEGSMILVGQAMEGLEAPQDRKLLEEVKEKIPLGESKYFDKNSYEEILYPNTDGWLENQMAHRAVLVSKMRVHPLEQLMPPPELVQSCRNTCVGLQHEGIELMTEAKHRIHRTLLAHSRFAQLER